MPDRREVWLETAHKEWKKALKYRQDEVDAQRILLQLKATGPVKDAALQVTKWSAFLRPYLMW
ncbi:hypothetical protein [Streptomyces albidoflavus]|uniref:hypothetical protein n=1 Tax=Streptomyces albidoflavus TaxID=1886 RepID=UPI001C47372D|nr:hypothetical protein [Streptomyces albidoflavus]MBV7652660.1 hypothetical protein [Streptomyces albidoflavus]MBV7714129.1 hypothetical protein [Streptomyces albidoflavus]